MKNIKKKKEIFVKLYTIFRKSKKYISNSKDKSKIIFKFIKY